MNYSLTRSLKTLAAAAVLATATLPAQAAEGLAARIAGNVSGIIAVQGNLAFQQIRDDMSDELVRKFENWLPETGNQDGSPVAELAQLHQQARQTAAGRAALQ